MWSHSRRVVHVDAVPVLPEMRLPAPAAVPPMALPRRHCLTRIRVAFPTDRRPAAFTPM